MGKIGSLHLKKKITFETNEKISIHVTQSISGSVSVHWRLIF